MAEFKPEWSELDATRESLREHMRMARVLLTQIKDLRDAAAKVLGDHPEIRAADAVIAHYTVSAPQQPTPSPTAQDPNQCDGCARGLPVNEHGVHRGPGSFDAQVCTADRYATPSEAAQRKEKP